MQTGQENKGKPNGFLHEMISIAQTYTYPVCYFFLVTIQSKFSPVMAFVTYILLAALHSGLQSRFHPEVLGRVASKALFVVLIEFGVIKLGCYLLNISGSHQVTDLVAYGGYKFVG